MSGYSKTLRPKSQTNLDCAPDSPRSHTIMPFGRLSPVSETDTESLHTNAPSIASDELRPRPLNFSRPRPLDIPSSRNVHRDNLSLQSSSSSSTTPSVHTLSAFYNPPQQQALPDEPHFDDDESDEEEDDAGDGPEVVTPASDFAWDFTTGGVHSRQRISELDAQRSTYPNGSTSSADSRKDSTAASSHSTADASDQPLIAELPGSEPPLNQGYQHQPQQTLQPPVIPQKTPRIVKRMSVDQHSEHRLSIDSTTTGGGGRSSGNGSVGRNGSRGGWEDGSSHHTLSINGEAGEGMDPAERWKSSNYDASQLGEKKLAKLRKKGINPNLYMEMKAARGGKGKLVGPLVGNTYIG